MKMYEVIERQKPAKNLIAFKAIANRYFKRGKSYETVKGIEYLYCCMETCKRIHVFLVCKSSRRADYRFISLLCMKELTKENLANDELYQLAITLI